VSEARVDVQLLARSDRQAERWRDKLAHGATKVAASGEPIIVTCQVNREGEPPHGFTALTANGVKSPFAEN
jgi:hypothetical protein